MSRNFSVTRVGTDSSGRGIFMTAYMAAWWTEYCDRLGFVPAITQGAHMSRNGGGAKASVGYHDLGGALDLRTRDRTPQQRRRMIRVARRMGAAAWYRDQVHGGFQDPHLHLVVIGDRPLTSGLVWQIDEYIAGRDGLASSGPDYHWRPDPLVLDWDPTVPTPGLSRWLAAKLPARRRMTPRLIKNTKVPGARAELRRWRRRDAKRRKWDALTRESYAALKKLEVKP